MMTQKLPEEGVTYEPRQMKNVTFSRHVAKVLPHLHNPAYDRVQYHRVLADGSLGAIQSSYASSWHDWTRKFDAKPEGSRALPDFPGSLQGVEVFARTSDGQWHFINSVGAWETCPPPLA